MQPRLVVVDEDAGRDVHGVAQQSPSDAALADDLLDLRRDVQEAHPRRQVERQVFGVRLHLGMLRRYFARFKPSLDKMRR